MPVVVPPYQNFVPGIGHKLMPSAHDIKAAEQAGTPPPQPQVTTEEHVRAWSPVRKHGHENFIPGKGHKLMPTWQQIHEQEAAEAQAAAGERAPEPEPEADAAHACTSCDKTFPTYAALRGHQLHHRGK